MARASFTWNAGRFVASKRKQLERVMTAVALQGEGEGKVILSTPGTGRAYKRGKSVTHIASSPGQPPAPDIGDLRKKLTHEVIVRGDLVVARVISPQRQSLALELGTDKIAPRPFMRPLLAKMRAAARKLLGSL